MAKWEEQSGNFIQELDFALCNLSQSVFYLDVILRLSYLLIKLFLLRSSVEYLILDI